MLPDVTSSRAKVTQILPACHAFDHEQGETVKNKDLQYSQQYM